MTPTYAVLVRVSQMGARKATDASFHADEEQVRESVAYIEKHFPNARHEILPPELNVSGGAAIKDRPSLRAAIEGVEAGTYAGLVAANIRRLTRSRSGLEIWDRIEAAGGTVHAATEGLDTSTPNGRFVRDIHLASAVCEREEKIVEFAARRKGSVDAGIWAAGNTPRGYDKGEDRRLIPSTDASLVARCFADRAAGGTVMGVARALGCGANTARGILRNRVYLGEVWSGEHVNRSAHPAIVDVATFDACQIEHPRPPRSTLAAALLGGLVRCAGCGYVMKRGQSSASQKDGRGKKYVTYACPSYRNCTGCDAPASISATRLDSWVEAELARPMFDHHVTQARTIHDVSAEREAAKMAGLELDAWIVNVSASSPSYAQGLAARESALQTAEGVLDARLAQIPSRLPVDTYDELTPAQRNQWLRTWLSAVVVSRRPHHGKGSPRDVPVSERVRVVPAGDGEAVAGVLAA